MPKEQHLTMYNTRRTFNLVTTTRDEENRAIKVTRLNEQKVRKQMEKLKRQLHKEQEQWETEKAERDHEEAIWEEELLKEPEDRDESKRPPKRPRMRPKPMSKRDNHTYLLYKNKHDDDYVKELVLQHGGFIQYYTDTILPNASLLVYPFLLYLISSYCLFLTLHLLMQVTYNLYQSNF